MKMKECFGFLPLDQDDEILDSKAKQCGCSTCDQRYNCLCLSAITTGTLEKKKVENLLNIVKIDQKREDFDKKIREKFKKLREKFKNSPEEFVKGIDSFFIDEINKEENKDIRDVYIEFIKKNYLIVKEMKRKLEDVMMKLDINFDG